MNKLEVRPLEEGLPFGARIAGVTREMLGDPEVRKQINQVFEDRGMIVFEDVEPTRADAGHDQRGFRPAEGPSGEDCRAARPGYDARRHHHPRRAQCLPSSRSTENGSITWQPWHFDHTYNNELNRAGVLRAEVIAPEGGLHRLHRRHPDLQGHGPETPRRGRKAEPDLHARHALRAPVLRPAQELRRNPG